MNIQNATHKLILSDELAKIIPYSQNHLRRLEAAGDFPKTHSNRCKPGCLAQRRGRKLDSRPC